MRTLVPEDDATPSQGDTYGQEEFQILPGIEVLEAPPLNEAQGACYSSQDEEEDSSQDEEEDSSTEDSEDYDSSPAQAVRSKMQELVRFLLLKYHAKELTTKAEMLSSVIKEHQDDFTVIFTEASLCLQRLFGIDVKEVYTSNHFYILVNSLGLTYNAVVSHGHSMPTNGLLIMVLCIIARKGASVSEKKMWEHLNFMGMYDGVEHHIYGDPRELLTKVWVQKQYLEYRKVIHSDPPHYEFLWGPRAHVETSETKVICFVMSPESGVPDPLHPSPKRLSDEEQGA